MQSVKYRVQVSNMRPAMKAIWDNLQGWLAGSPDLEIVIRPYKSKRTIEQNKRLWKIYQVIADEVWVQGRRYDAETWHEYFKGRLIGYNERLLPNGEVLKTPISTTTLNTAEMTDYQNRLQAWGAGRGIIWDF